MSKKLIAAALIALVGIPVAYFGATTFLMSASQEQVSDTADRTTISTCQSVKQNQCAMGEVSESDYPGSCFQNGEHVLDNPYQC